MHLNELQSILARIHMGGSNETGMQSYDAGMAKNMYSTTNAKAAAAVMSNHIVPYARRGNVGGP